MRRKLSLQGKQGFFYPGPSWNGNGYVTDTDISYVSFPFRTGLQILFILVLNGFVHEYAGSSFMFCL